MGDPGEGMGALPNVGRRPAACVDDAPAARLATPATVSAPRGLTNRPEGHTFVFTLELTGNVLWLWTTASRSSKAPSTCSSSRR